MKHLLRMMFVSVLTLVAVRSACAQGSLTPPGAPAPTMKTLDQIEPRKPISSLPYGITSPGSYYVTSNLTGIASFDGIQIYVSDVVLDLNGFTLTGLSNSLYGVYTTTTCTNISIRNGTFRNWSGGIAAFTGRACKVSDVRVVRCGYPGIYVGPGSTVEHCGAFDGVSGIVVEDGTRITDCLSVSNQFDGIGSFVKSIVIEHCTAKNNGGNGIVVGPAGLVADCLTEGNGTGVSTGEGSLVRNCNAFGNNGAGIYLGFNSRVLDSQCVSNSYIGVFLPKGCVAERCTAAFSGSQGFYVQDNTTVQDCVALANGDDGITLVTGNTSVFNSNTRSNVGYGVNLNNGQGIVSGNVIENNRNGGVTAASYSVIKGNTIRSNGVASILGGIWLTGRGNQIEANTCIGNTGYGIFANFAANTNNLIIRNSATANSSGNYVFNVTNHFVNVSGGNLATNTNPHVNFSF